MAVLCTAAFLLLGIGVWSKSGVTGQDEFWLSFRTALDTHGTDGWWFPTIDGEPRLKKPPLLYWLMVASFELFGSSVFAARLPSVIFGVGFVLAIAKIAERGRVGAGPLAGWLALATAAIAVESRRAMLDLPLGCMTAWAVVCGLRAADLEGARARWSWLAAGVFAGAGAMLKGPAVLIFLGGALIAAIPDARRRGVLAARLGGVALGALAMLLVSLPWPISAALAHSEFSDILGNEAKDRDFAWIRAKSLGQVPGGVLAIAVPWSFCLLHALGRAARGRFGATSETARWWATWLVLSAAAFLSFRVFERYLIPLLAAAIPLVAVLLLDLGDRARRRHQVAAAALLALPTGLFAFAAYWFEGERLLPMASLALIGGSIAVALRAGPIPSSAMIATSLAAALGLVYPAIGVNRIGHGLPEDSARLASAHYDSHVPAMLSMELERCITRIDAGDVKRLGAFDGYVHVQEHRRSHFLRDAAAARIEHEFISSLSFLSARKNFVRIARPGATAADWRLSFKLRSTEPIEDVVHVVRVRPAHSAETLTTFDEDAKTD